MAKYQNGSLEGLTKTIKQQQMPIPSRNNSDAVNANSHLDAFWVSIYHQWDLFTFVSFFFLLEREIFCWFTNFRLT